MLYVCSTKSVEVVFSLVELVLAVLGVLNDVKDDLLKAEESSSVEIILVEVSWDVVEVEGLIVVIDCVVKSVPSSVAKLVKSWVFVEIEEKRWVVSFSLVVCMDVSKVDKKEDLGVASVVLLEILEEEEVEETDVPSVSGVVIVDDSIWVELKQKISLNVAVVEGLVAVTVVLLVEKLVEKVKNSDVPSVFSSVLVVLNVVIDGWVNVDVSNSVELKLEVSLAVVVEGLVVVIVEVSGLDRSIVGFVEVAVVPSVSV